MSCNPISTYTLGCRDKQGGVQKVFIGTYNSTLSYSYGTDNIIATFSAGTVSFYTIEQELESATFDQKGVYNSENGTSYYEQDVTIVLNGLSANLREQIKIMGQGKWRIFVLDQTGRYWLVGKQNGVRVSDGNPNVGKAMGDLNGATMKFSGKEPEPAHEISSAAALGLIV